MSHRYIDFFFVNVIFIDCLITYRLDSRQTEPESRRRQTT